jgi:hypothetical protein
MASRDRRQAIACVYLFLPPLFLDDLRDVFRDDFREGTLAPFSRASLRPIAIACLRLFTLRPEPLFRVPFFLRCIADFTLLDAALPYLAIDVSLLSDTRARGMLNPTRPRVAVVISIG